MYKQSFETNRSLLHGDIPHDLISANVVLFIKRVQGDKNYHRPVNLISIVGKLLESIIRDQIQKCLEENKLTYSTQYGFTKG